jgi:hypothetical protein
LQGVPALCVPSTRFSESPQAKVTDGPEFRVEFAPAPFAGLAGGGLAWTASEARKARAGKRFMPLLYKYWITLGR